MRVVSYKVTIVWKQKQIQLIYNLDESLKKKKKKERKKEKRNTPKKMPHLHHLKIRGN